MLKHKALRLNENSGRLFAFKSQNSQAHQHTILRATTIDAIAMQGAT